MTIVVSSTPAVSATVYNNIVTSVYALTKRPDLVTETAIAIRKATMKVHMADFWKNDLSEIHYTLPVLAATGVAFRYSLDLTDTVSFPLFRKVSHIKEWNNPLVGYEIQLKELDADRILDDYALETINYWYQAGRQVSLRCNKLLVTLNIGYWKYPNIIPATYSSWIAQDFPDIIIEEAASAVFKVIGKDIEYTRLANNFQENIHMLTMTQVG